MDRLVLVKPLLPIQENKKTAAHFTLIPYILINHINAKKDITSFIYSNWLNCIGTVIHRARLKLYKVHFLSSSH